MRESFIEYFDEVLDIYRKYDIVLSLGNTARSGCIHVRRDYMQLAEIRQNVNLADRAMAAGVQMIIEGAGGHIWSDHITPMVKYYKKKSVYPLFVAGSLPTDVAVGYDNIYGAAGASIASASGANYLCYIIPPRISGFLTR